MEGGRGVVDYTRGRVRVRFWSNHDNERNQQKLLIRSHPLNDHTRSQRREIIDSFYGMLYVLVLIVSHLPD